MFHQEWEPVVLRKTKSAPVNTHHTKKEPDENKKTLKVYSKELSDKMIQARCQMRLSQFELAKRCNVVTGVIQEMESRKGIYDAEVTNKVCKVLKIHVDHRFTLV